MLLRARLARSIARAGIEPAWRRFEAALTEPELAQEGALAGIIAGMSLTRYGAEYGLSSGDDYSAFRMKVPIVDYSSLAPWINEQRATEERVLCVERVLFYEQTSGSSGAVKWIPYTRSLKRSFHRTFALWLRDLLVHGPDFETGRTWLSVSPFVARKTVSERGIPVGLDHDSDYIGGWLGGLLSSFWAVPASVRGIPQAEAFRDAVASHLLAAEDLEIISLWNPSMLTSFCEHIVARRETLLETQSRGRRSSLRSLLAAGDAEKVDWLSVWPKLKLLSCWDQAHAKDAAAQARRLLPGVLVQGKGHLATEAPVTIPLLERGLFAPLVDEVFYEFEEANGAVRRLHELTPGREYALIISQHGGLCRYRLGDRVRAGAPVGATPSLTLVGRADPVCDLVGEKLHSDFAAEALEHSAPDSRFRLMIPVPARPGRSAGYLVVADRAHPEFGARLEERLRESPQYRQARDMGQLAALTVRVRADARSVVESHHLAAGRVLGGVKPAPLILDPGEGARLAERFDHV
jgi:hypothetical protein